MCGQHRPGRSAALPRVPSWRDLTVQVGVSFTNRQPDCAPNLGLFRWHRPGCEAARPPDRPLQLCPSPLFVWPRVSEGTSLVTSEFGESLVDGEYVAPYLE